MKYCWHFLGKASFISCYNGICHFHSSLLALKYYTLIIVPSLWKCSVENDKLKVDFNSFFDINKWKFPSDINLGVSWN